MGNLLDPGAQIARPVYYLGMSRQNPTSEELLKIIAMVTFAFATLGFLFLSGLLRLP